MSEPTYEWIGDPIAPSVPRDTTKNPINDQEIEAEISRHIQEHGYSSREEYANALRPVGQTPESMAIAELIGH